MNCLSTRIHDIENRFDADSLKYFIEGLYKTDHWPSFKNFHKTANWIADTLNAYEDITARVIEFPADGKTMYGDWIMPCAWDAFSAHLSDCTTGEIFVDYEKVPTAMIMGSGATPKEGFQAELVYLDTPADLESTDVHNKIILTGFAPQAIKKTVAEKGGLALIFASVIGDDMNDAVRWVNSWADDPGLWSVTKRDTDLPGLSLSVNQAAAFKNRLAAGEKITLDINIQTRTYDGTLPVVEAFIPGETAEEVFITGHLYEQGANDNSSGGATMMEIARIFAGSKPKRGIRFLFTSEIYGTVPYCHDHKELLKNTVAGINIDSTAEVGRRSKKMDIIQNPLTNPSFVNILMKEIINASGKESQFAFQNFLLDDNLVTDPAINIPCVLVGVCSTNWHTSYDTLDIIDWGLFNLTTRICASWVDVVANGGQAEAELLQSATDSFLADWTSTINDTDYDSPVAAYQNDYINEVTSAFQCSLNQIHPVYPEATAYLNSEGGPHRSYFGPPSFSQIDSDRRNKLGLNMWAGSSYFPFFYADGNRSQERIAAYTQLSFNIAYENTLNMLTELTNDGYFS